MLACDFFETFTLSGTRLYVLTVIKHANRRIRVLGATAHAITSGPHKASPTPDHYTHDPFANRVGIDARRPWRTFRFEWTFAPASRRKWSAHIDRRSWIWMAELADETTQPLIRLRRISPPLGLRALPDDGRQGGYTELKDVERFCWTRHVTSSCRKLTNPTHPARRPRRRALIPS